MGLRKIARNNKYVQEKKDAHKNKSRWRAQNKNTYKKEQTHAHKQWYFFMAESEE